MEEQWPVCMRSGRIKTAIILLFILLLGLFLRVQLSQDPYLHEWDERFHALVAKHLAANPFKPVLYKDALLSYDYKSWSSNHIWLHKQPLPLWLIACSYKAFGLSEFNTRLPSILFSTLSIYIVYLLGRYLFTRRTGLLAALFLAINGLIVEMCSGRIATDHYDTLFMSFILLGIFYAYCNATKPKPTYTVLSGLFMGMAVMTKWLPALIILPVHLSFLLRSGLQLKPAMKPVLISMGICCLVALPWQIYILYTYPQEAKWEYYHHWLHITSELDQQSGGYFYFIDKIRINYSEIIYLPLTYLLHVLFKSRFRDYKYLALAIWVFLPLLFFSLAKTKMQGYILFIAPALFLITADFYTEVRRFLKEGKASKSLTVPVYLLLSAVIILPVRYCIERTVLAERDAGSARLAAQYSKEDVPEKAVVLGIENPIEFMFYNDCIAYSDTVITHADWENIKRTGYPVYIYKDNSLLLLSNDSLRPFCNRIR